MRTIDYSAFKSVSPRLLLTVTNQLGQFVSFYESPLFNLNGNIYCEVERTVFLTDQTDLTQFFEGSEFLPCQIGNEIMMYHEIDPVKHRIIILAQKFIKDQQILAPNHIQIVLKAFFSAYTSGLMDANMKSHKFPKA